MLYLNNKKGETGVSTAFKFLIAFLAVGVAVLFTLTIASSGEDSQPNDIRGIIDYEKYKSLCILKCTKANVRDMAKCTETIEDVPYYCGEIIAGGDDSTLDPPDGSSTKPAYTPEGEFQPCSTMTLTLKEDVTDLGIKIKPKEGSDSEAIVIRDESGSDLTILDEGYYKLCESTCSNIAFQLPCEKKTELEEFKPDDYEISFNVEGINPITKIWTCLKDASFPDGINFNQMGTKDITKVKFKKEVKSASASHMNADIQIVFDETGGGCKDPDTGTTITNCRIEPSHELGLKYDEDESYYHFTMPKINGELKEILFNILINAEGSDVGVCTAKVSASMRCNNPERYICYGETDDDDNYREYFLYSRSDAGEYTLDGVCKYSEKTEYKTGCVDISTGELGDENEVACHRPEKIYRKETIIEDVDTRECKSPPDLVIEDIYPCISTDDCNANTQFFSTDEDQYLAFTIRNNGPDITIYPEDLHITINGGDEEVYSIPNSGLVIPEGELKVIDEISAIGLVGNDFENVGNTVRVEIANIDTAIYPVIDEEKREKNNVKEETMTVYRKCCSDCVSCPDKAICNGCYGICIWKLNAADGIYGCAKR
ncbi:MAG: hypothetical protein KAH93_06240, partial [Candidatus Aenigmarchaeota archaeon]|nr:hypothetical protein [Candidatus Aenigmarchaeota archaeon]